MQNYPPSGPNDPTYTPPQPYPAYAPPPGSPPRKHRTWLWILLGALALLVLGCVGLVTFATLASQSGTQPQATNTPVGNTPATGTTPAPTKPSAFATFGDGTYMV